MVHGMYVRVLRSSNSRTRPYGDTAIFQIEYTVLFCNLPILSVNELKNLLVVTNFVVFRTVT